MIQLSMYVYAFKVVVVFLVLASSLFSKSLEKVSLQLDWKYQFQHAGFIVGKEKGFYKEVGLDVTLLEYEDGINIEEDVLRQKVDFGISNTPLMIKNGVIQPTVLLATYLQRSALVLVTQPEINEPSQLNGKVVMTTEYEYKNSSLSLFLEHFFVNAIYTPHTYTIDEFKDKKVDAMSVFTSNEIYELDKQNVPYHVMDPYDYGFITNAINVFSSYKTVKEKSVQVANFIKATKKGWLYALDNTEEIIEIIHTKYNPKKSIEELRFEAKKIRKLMLLGLYDIGEISKELTMRSYKQLVRSDKALPNQEKRIVIFDEVLKNIKNENIQFTEKEKKYLLKKKKIKLCVDPDWMPFEGLRDGKYVGMIADYFDLVRKKLDIDIVVYPTKSWDESIASIKSRKCDIIGSASPTNERLKYMNFTDTYMSSPIVLVTKVDKPFVQNIESVIKKRLGISKGYAIAEILKDKYPDINIIDVDNIEDGFKKVESGKIYGYIDNLTITVSVIQQSFHGILKVSARLDESDDLTIGSRNDEPILNEVFQKIVHNIDDSKVRSILNSWISVKESTGMNYVFLWKAATGIVIVFLIFLVYGFKLRQLNKKLETLSREDALTKIGNRLKLNEVLLEEYKYSVRYGVICGVILIDIDDFKKINDIYGHLFGDKVLIKFTKILSKHIRDTDKIGRWGGEEFLIVCPNINRENLIKVAEGLKKDIESDIFLSQKNLTASFGLSIFDGTKDIEEVLGEADKNLYEAKDSGKNRVCFS